MADLINDIDGVSIQAFPLTKEMISKTTGTFANVSCVCCVVDGNITLLAFGDVVPCVAGDVFSFQAQSVTVTSGTFHLA